MSKTSTTAKIRADGTVVEVLDDGSERLFPAAPLRPMTEAEVEPPPPPTPMRDR